MSSVSNILLDKEILLESGTNEVELLVFHVGGYTCAMSLPQAHSSIRGVFKLRNDVIPCVSLLDHLGIAPTGENTESTMILSDFNQQQTAFLVDQVERIYRISWKNILPVPGLDALAHAPVTALALWEDRLILMLDFEKIHDEVTEQYFRTDAVDNPLGLAREELRILLAEDSPTVREAISNTLYQSGYQQVVFRENGAKAWQWFTEQLKMHGCVEEFCDLVICDVEMPQMDGLHLTRRIKEHPVLKTLPVLLYSSVITPDNYKKGQAVGADAQVSKPELAKVVHLADELIHSARQKRRAQAVEQVACRIEPAPDKASRAEADSAGAPPANEEAAPPAAAEDQPGPSAQQQPALKEQEKADSQPTTAGAQQPARLPEDGKDWPSTAESSLAEVGCAEAGSRPSHEDQPAACAEARTELCDDPSADGASPSQPDPKLWRTFLRELKGRLADLHALLGQAAQGEQNEQLRRQIARLLHTIKSAAMVVPVDQITYCTHAAEGLLEAASNGGPWPQKPLEQYAEWIFRVVTADDGVEQILAEGEQLARAWQETPLKQ